MFSLCYVTTPSMAVAKTISHLLVKEGQAACVNIVPSVVSIYSWQGTMHTDDECMLLIKTQTAKVPKVIEIVRSSHPYDCPEVISVPMGPGNPAYLQWIKQCTTTGIQDNVISDDERDRTTS